TFKNWAEISEARALFHTGPGTDSPKVTVVFAKDRANGKPVPRYWRSPTVVEPQSTDKPLSGLKIAIDPGHLGGSWARMEERWFQEGDSAPIIEGDLTLRVAQILAPKLTGLGAQVDLVRTGSEPATNLCPS